MTRAELADALDVAWSLKLNPSVLDVPEHRATLLEALREPDEAARLLSRWANIAKGLGLATRIADVADYDDEIASNLAETATATLEWRAAREG